MAQITTEIESHQTLGVDIFVGGHSIVSEYFTMVTDSESHGQDSLKPAPDPAHALKKLRTLHL